MPKSIKEKIKFFIIKRALKSRGVNIHHHSYIVNTEFTGKATVEPYCRILGDNRIYIGNNFYCNANCHFLGEINIGNDVMIGPKTVIWARDHGIQLGTLMREQKHYKAPINIGDNVWVGANVTILKGVTIGSGAVIGAGSVVTKDVPTNSIVAGNPAKVVKKRI